MNSIVCRTTLCSPKSILRPASQIMVSARGGRVPAQSQGVRGAKRKWYGLTVPLGSFVHEKDVFLKQSGLKFHPGLNAALDPRDNAIYALCDGHIALTTELFNPDFSNPTVSKFYQEHYPTKMHRYLHVIPTKPPIEFKLVDLV